MSAPGTATTDEEISWDAYVAQIERPVAACLEKTGLREKILYIAPDPGRAAQGGRLRAGIGAEYASVDSELALLYAKRKGRAFERAGPVSQSVLHGSATPIPPSAVSHLPGDASGGLGRGRREGHDRQGPEGPEPGPIRAGHRPAGQWRRQQLAANAALLLPRGRVSWTRRPAWLRPEGRDRVRLLGVQRRSRARRWSGFEWLPGAIATEFVSTNARTMQAAAGRLVFADRWDGQSSFRRVVARPQRGFHPRGRHGSSGNVYEPFLNYCVRPDYLLPAYYQGRNLAESFISRPVLSWQEVVLGDPRCRRGGPGNESACVGEVPLPHPSP